MIKCFNRNQLDVEKYNACISNAFNSRIYACSWYLDIVCDDWDVLVKDDYQFVMPLPKRKKLGIQYIYQAPWIQQLGVFSPMNIEGSIIAAFINAIPKKFKLIDVFFNAENRFSNKNIKIRTNYILDLDKPYDSIRKQYSKGRKSSIKLAQNLTVVDNFDPTKIIQLFKQNKGIELGKKDSDYIILNELIVYAISQNHVQSLGVVNTNNKLIGGAFFLKDTYRITYLFSAINSEGRERQAMSYLMDYVIKRNTESECVFDFEGSMIKELASFFKSFGAKKEQYYQLKYNRLPRLLKVIEK